jgi:glycosyltransferase involved in cell wall biosynthesis
VRTSKQFVEATSARRQISAAETAVPRITVLIPCRNERSNIRPCIESARKIADEVLVADSGSVDETPAIARALGARVIEREFVDYADFKNWAIPQAAHEWVFILDADERITDELAAEIRRVLNGPVNVDGFWVLRRGFFMGHEVRHSGWNSDDVFRLIRRDVCRYRACRVHEEIQLDGLRQGRLEEPMLHYTYWTYDQYFEKYVRYTRWGAQDKFERGERTSTFQLLVRPFLRFLYLYVFRGGFLDGKAGIQVCMLQSFFVTFVKQGRLWEMEHAVPQPRPEPVRLASISELDDPVVSGDFLLPPASRSDAKKRREMVSAGD